MKILWSNVIVAVVSTLVTLALVNFVFPAMSTADPSPSFKLVNQRNVASPAVTSGDQDWTVTPNRQTDWPPVGNSEPTQPLSGYPDFRTISQKVTPAVVNITLIDQSGYRVASGSGVAVTKDGYIITNQHVIEDAREIEVTFPDKHQYLAELVGEDPTTDLALLKIDADNIPAILFGDSDRISVGEWVLAIGNPFNLTSTVTAGIISAKGRNINILESAYAIESFIQTDAVVNPGNSGGALLNTNGELIGINTAIITESGGYEGYSFAIPSNLVRKIVTDLREYGRVQRAVLGVEIRELDNDIAEEAGMASTDGVLILRVTEDGSADRAGLTSGDIIVSINDRRISSIPELQEQVARHRPGDTIDLEYFRDGLRLKEYNVELRALKRK